MATNDDEKIASLGRLLNDKKYLSTLRDSQKQAKFRQFQKLLAQQPLQQQQSALIDAKNYLEKEAKEHPSFNNMRLAAVKAALSPDFGGSKQSVIDALSSEEKRAIGLKSTVPAPAAPAKTTTAVPAPVTTAAVSAPATPTKTAPAVSAPAATAPVFKRPVFNPVSGGPLSGVSLLGNMSRGTNRQATNVPSTATPITRPKPASQPIQNKPVQAKKGGKISLSNKGKTKTVVSGASKRGDGIASRGKTRGRIV